LQGVQFGGRIDRTKYEPNGEASRDFTSGSSPSLLRWVRSFSNALRRILLPGQQPRRSSVKDDNIASVDRVLVGIRHHLAAAKQLILKEVVSIGSTSGGASLEYRVVGVDGKFVAFDFDAAPGTLQPPSSFGLDSFASKALASLAERGGSGPVFLDVAVLTDGRTPTVVECKDFHYGTIANPEAIAQGLRRLEMRF
jgi:hypothetical protein